MRLGNDSILSTFNSKEDRNTLVLVEKMKALETQEILLQTLGENPALLGSIKILKQEIALIEGGIVKSRSFEERDLNKYL